MSECERCGKEVKLLKEGNHEYFCCDCGVIEIETVCTSEDVLEE